MHRSFFEIKTKQSDDRTVKYRAETPSFVDDFATVATSDLAGLIPAAYGPLEPKVWSDFYCVTLVGRARPERVTLDFDLRLASTERAVALPNVVVAEVKQARADGTSPFVHAMRAAHVRPVSISKYCVGVALLYPQVKHNTFKPRLRAIAALA